MQRLRTREQYEAVLAGATVARSAHFALHRCPLQAAGDPALPVPEPVPAVPTGPGSVRSQALFAVQAPWIGAVVPKRWAKRAVTRNTIKRQIYAMAQDAAAALPPAAHVVRLRAGFDRQRYPSATSEPLKRAIRHELAGLFSKAQGAHA
jgi:ribonuclease P protein component